MEEAEGHENAERIMEHGHPRLNRVVAITVVIIAVFMAVARVKSEKTTERMQVAQAQALDQWNFYQAKSVKQHMYTMTVENWKLERDAGTLSPAARPQVEKKLSQWQAEISRYDKEKADIQGKAEQASSLRERLEVKNDWLHTAESLFALSIALWPWPAWWGVGSCMAPG